MIQEMWWRASLGALLAQDLLAKRQADVVSLSPDNVDTLNTLLLPLR